METYNNDRANQPALAVRIETVKPFTKNTLRAFVDFELIESGLLIHGATVHEKGGSRWLTLPCREYEKGGQRGWAPIIEVPDKRTRWRLQDSVLAAYDAYLARPMGGAR